MDLLAKYLENAGILESEAIMEAFAKVERKDFVLKEYEDRAYGDYPLPIGHGQTISQPYTVAFMLELLQPRQGEKILDVGSGSGWTTALLASLVGKKGRVYGTELVPELVRFGRSNLAKYDFLQAEILQAKKGKVGLPAKAPFDKILVSAAASNEIPQELVAQLKEGGLMVLPVEDAVFLVEKLKGKKVDVRRFGGFAFVPLR